MKLLISFLLAHRFVLVASDQQGPIKSVPFELQKSWAEYTPYFPLEDYKSPPKNCKVTQLQRHGARFPTSGNAALILPAVSKLLSVQKFTDPRLEFLKNYTYSLGVNDLVPFGAEECQMAGKVHFARYANLVSHEKLPFVRATSSERVVLSATNWTAGFSVASRHIFNPTLSVILSESLNNTLTNSLCPNAGTSEEQLLEWVSTFGPPIVARLNRQAPGANLTAIDVVGLLSLCPFESVAMNARSPFCNLFTSTEFQQFEYTGDLTEYYGTGYGQPLGPVQGVGYINELIARLTGKPVRDDTQTNRTLDSSPATFPLDRTIYADFTHDSEMSAIYAAMGLFRQRVDLNPSHPDPKRTWLASQLVPFASRMITEKVMCGRDEYVRVLVNDARQPLEFCGAGKDGMCELQAFVASQAYARNNGDGDFEKCFS